MAALFHVGSAKRRSSRAFAPPLLRCSVVGRLAAGAAARLDRSRRRCRGAWCGACAWSGPWARDVSARAGPRSAPGMRSSTSAGQPASAASGAGATSSARARPACRRRHGGQHVGRGDGAVVLDVRRDLDDVAARQVQPERAHAGQPLLPALADRGGDRARVVERRGRRELDVEGDQRRPRGDERRARGRVQLGRAVVGRGAARGEPLRAALAQLGARAPVGQLAVEEDGDAGRADRVGGEQRLGDRRAALRVVEVDDRRDVERADARVQPVVVAQVDPRGGRRRRRRRARGAARPGSPARKKTARWWSASAERCSTSACVANAAPIASSTASSRPSETFGTATSRVMREHEAAAVEHARAADVERRVLDQAVEVDGHRDRAADAGARAERDVDRAEHLLVLEDVAGQRRALVRADAELGEVRARSGRRASSSAAQRAPHSPLGVGEPAVLDGQPDGLVRRGRGSRASRRRASPRRRAARRSPRRTAGSRTRRRARRSPSSAIPSRPVRSSAKSVPRGQVTCASSAPVSSSATARLRAAIRSGSRTPSAARACPR